MLIRWINKLIYSSLNSKSLIMLHYKHIHSYMCNTHWQPSFLFLHGGAVGYISNLFLCRKCSLINVFIWYHNVCAHCKPFFSPATRWLYLSAIKWSAVNENISILYKWQEWISYLSLYSLSGAGLSSEEKQPFTGRSDLLGVAGGHWCSWSLM